MRISDWSSDVCSSDLAAGKRARGEILAGDHRHRDGARQNSTQAEMNFEQVQEAAGPNIDVANVVEIGRASCRERVCKYVSISVVAVSLKKKQQTETTKATEAKTHESIEEEQQS